MSEIVDNFAEELFKSIKCYEEATNTLPTACIIQNAAKELLDDLANRGYIVSPYSVEHSVRKREERKRIRWEEKNRKLKVKGAEIKPNPYPRYFSYVIVYTKPPRCEIPIKFVLE